MLDINTQPHPLPKQFKKSVLANIANILFPPHCLLCHCSLTGQRFICELCYAELPWLTASCCRICANVLPSTAANTAICGQCLAKPPYFNRTYTLFKYAFPMNKLIAQWKFQAVLHYGRFFADLLTDYIVKQYRHDQLPSLLLPVPLHRKRLRQRGFNQAVELARPLSQRFQIPLSTNMVVRHRHTAAQAGAVAKQRKRNMRAAFLCRQGLTHKHIAIIDDVLTTGSTVNELSNVLRQQGVKRIDIWTCARTIGFANDN